MGAYSFKEQFIPFVMDGSKTHTIRSRRRYPDKTGGVAHLFYGLRTKQCRKLFSAPVLNVQTIKIESYEAVQNSPFALGGNHVKGAHRGPNGESLLVTIDGVLLSADEARALFRRDGFRDKDWCPQYLALLFWEKKNLPFFGHIIHWDYSRRVLPERVQV